MKLTKTLSDIFKKAGLEGNEELKKILEEKAEVLDAIEIPAIGHNMLMENLFNVDEGKNNGALKNHFVGQFGDGVETATFKALKEIGLSDADIAEIKGSTKNTGERISLSLTKVNAMLADAKTKGKGNQSDEFVRQLKEATDQIEVLKNQFENEKKGIVGTYASKLEASYKRANLVGVQWNDAIPEDARLPSYEAALNRKLKEVKGKMVFDPDKEEMVLVQEGDPTLPLTIQNKPISYSELHSLVLQDSNLLAKKPDGGPGGFRQPTPTGGGPPDPNGNTKIAPYVQRNLDNAQKTLEEMANQS